MNEETNPSPSAHSTPYQPRRKFLKMLGFGSAFAITHPVLGQVRFRAIDPSKVQLDKTKLDLPQPIRPDYTPVHLLRPEDLLSLELRFHGFIRQGQLLKRVQETAHLVVVFPPQSITEQSWKESATALETPTLPGAMFIGDTSRLVFSIPPSLTELPLDSQTLLTWDRFEPAVSPRARPASTRKVTRPANISARLKDVEEQISKSTFRLHPALTQNLSKSERELLQSMMVKERPGLSRRDAIRAVPKFQAVLSDERVRAPGPLETAIEVPNRLYLSPCKTSAWKHSITAKTDPGIIKETNRLFELWHTRLASRTSEGIDESEATAAQRILRAIWADDAKSEMDESVATVLLDKIVGEQSMTNRHRHCIVHESSNFQIEGFTPPPIEAYQLFLTTLGAWLNSAFVVEKEKLKQAGILYHVGSKPDTGFDLLKWRHIETLGREHYVEIVTAGHLLPFGHEGVKITITERKPHKETGTAANFRREIVVVTKPVKYYDYIDPEGRFMNFPFKRIEIMNPSTPLLDDPTAFIPGPSETEQFVIRSGDKDVLFSIRATDQDGKSIDFSMPLAFASTNVLGNSDNLNAFLQAYNQTGAFSGQTRINNRTQAAGQSFTLAPSVANGASTSFPAYAMQFGMQSYASPDELQGFLPTLREVNIVEPSYQRLTGRTVLTPVSLVDDRNEGAVFAQVTNPTEISFAGFADKTGGLASPNFQFTGLSKATGTVAGNLQKFMQANARADDFFSVANLPEPTLFGVFKLSELLDFGPAKSSAYDLNQPLNLRESKVPNLQSWEDANDWITSYVVQPGLKNQANAFVSFQKRNNARFAILTEIRSSKHDPQATPRFTTDASVQGFNVGVVQIKGPEYLISIRFEEVRFQVHAGKKADVSVEMQDDPIGFGGPLSFINAFTSLIDPKGFYDPPYVDVSLAGVRCGYTLALPNLQLGAFTLSHLGLAAEVNLPFSGAPMTVGFRFCERHQPFTLTISCLGGGGFFGFELDLGGLRQIEAALEFGAAVSMNFGVASGAVSVMAGIYFKMEFLDSQNSTQLTGYVRINGAVSVLGLITASIELYMALNYMIDSGKAIGEASLKIKVEVMFFSKTVTIRAQRTFAGSGDDPNFQMAITQDDWLDYCSAFAA